MKQWPPVTLQGVVRTILPSGVTVRVVGNWTRSDRIQNVWVFDCMDMSCNPKGHR